MGYCGRDCRNRLIWLVGTEKGGALPVTMGTSIMVKRRQPCGRCTQTRMKRDDGREPVSTTMWS